MAPPRAIPSLCTAKNLTRHTKNNRDCPVSETGALRAFLASTHVIGQGKKDGKPMENAATWSELMNSEDNSNEYKSKS